MTRSARVVALAVLALVLSVSIVGAGVAAAKDPPLTSPAYIAIDNGVINIDGFGEVDSCCGVWQYPASVSNCWYEEPYLAYGGNPPVSLTGGFIASPYPATGVPDVWYDATIDLDLDAGPGDDVTLTRSIMVPSGEKYFLVRYSVQNISGADLPGFRLFQAVDYDVAGDLANEAGYEDCDFVWAHYQWGAPGTWVGFNSSRLSAGHSVDFPPLVDSQLAAGVLNNADYYSGDVGVALEWRLGTIHAGESRGLTVKFAFADTLPELKSRLCMQPPPNVPTMSLWGTLGLTLLLAGGFVWAAYRRRVGTAA
jgi:hypothetical protein